MNKDREDEERSGLDSEPSQGDGKERGRESKEDGALVASGLGDVHTDFESGRVMEPVMDAAGTILKDVAGSYVDKAKEEVRETLDAATHPYRGKEDEILDSITKDDPDLWKKAYEAHPKLKEYLTREEAELLSKGITRNELTFFDLKDSIDGNTDDLNTTIGYSQLSQKAVNDLQGVSPALKELLKGRGYEQDAKRALEDPECVPMLVAAKLESLCLLYEKSKDATQLRDDRMEAVKPSVDSLAYGYNADVYFDPKKEKREYHSNDCGSYGKKYELAIGNLKAFPTANREALAESKHLSHVKEQMRIIEERERRRSREKELDLEFLSDYKEKEREKRRNQQDIDRER